MVIYFSEKCKNESIANLNTINSVLFFFEVFVEKKYGNFAMFYPQKCSTLKLYENGEIVEVPPLGINGQNFYIIYVTACFLIF